MHERSTNYKRVYLPTLTPRTAPAYVMITHDERNGPDCLQTGGPLLLLGPLGVNFYIDSSDSNGLYLRRWDVT